MLGRKTDNKRVMTPAEREGGKRTHKYRSPLPISIEVRKTSEDNFLLYDFGVFKGHFYRKFAYCGERSRVQYYCREFKGRARRPQQKVAEGGRWLGRALFP